MEEKIRENKRMFELLQRPHLEDIEVLEEKRSVEWQILAEHYQSSWAYERDRRCALDIKLTVMRIICAVFGTTIVLMFLYILLH